MQSSLEIIAGFVNMLKIGYAQLVFPVYQGKCAIPAKFPMRTKGTAYAAVHVGAYAEPIASTSSWVVAFPSSIAVLIPVA